MEGIETIYSGNVFGMTAVNQSLQIYKNCLISSLESPSENVLLNRVGYEKGQMNLLKVSISAKNIEDQ